MARLGRLACVGAAVAVALSAVVAVAPTAGADAVPYSDASAAGSVGLCDRNGHPVTGGSTTAKPFVWRAVSSRPAPAPFGGARAKATLLAYQPRPNAPADQWSGDILTATSSYTNPAYPMAQATPLDFSLQDFLLEFPPQVDGLVQLRIYFGAPNAGTSSSSYPATDIRVNGGNWTVVRGASVPCTNGSATSSETVTGAQRPVAAPSGAAIASGRPSSGAKSPVASSRPASTAPRQASSSAAASGSSANTGSSGTPSLASADDTANSSSRAPVLLVIGGLVVAGVAGGGYLWWRRRQPS